MEELLEILEAIKPGFDFESSTALIDDGILTSMDIIKLVSDLQDEFDVDIAVTDLVPENFNNIQAIMDMIKRLEDE